MTLLLPQHVADLRRSGLTDETIDAMGWYSEDDPSRLQSLLRWKRPAKGIGPCLVIRYRNLDGSLNGFARVRPDNPRTDERGSPVKYEQPAGEVVRAYFPLRSLPAIKRSSELLAITEGEKKSEAITQAGVPCIGLSGVWNWQKPRTAEQKNEDAPRLLIADLEQIDWSGRTVVIVFDTDDRHNPHVAHAKAELIRVLAEKGAKIFDVTLPQGERSKETKIPTKMGADDFLVAHGPDALLELIESQMQPPAKARTVDDFQCDLAAARLESLATGRGVVNLDRSPTGSGKSTADLPAMEKAGSSLTVLATHKNCDEAERVMRDQGMNAAAYPKLDEDSCENMYEAVKAMESGLSVSGAICPTCKFKDGCPYRLGLREAESAEHSIATHHRASLSFAELAEGRAYIAVHEDPTGLLRPSIELSHDLEDVIRVAGQADRRANDFVPEGRLELFYAHVKNAAHELQDHLDKGTATAALDVPCSVRQPYNAEAVLYHAMKEIGVWPKANAMRLCNYLAAGKIVELALRVDTTLGPGKTIVPHTSIVGFRQSLLPKNAVIWIADATADADEIGALSNLPVIDRTPGGSIRQQHPVVQIPIDLTKSTSRATFVRVLTSVINLYPLARRIGVICDRNHVPAVTGTAKSGPMLPEALQRRIVKVEHYRSGEGRGSNAWTADCDLLIVAGTPRVPPSVIKTRLLRRGMVEAAGRDEKWTAWGLDWWSGRTTAGHRVTIRALAYRDFDWRAAHAGIVKAELSQCVGRGRSIRENGIPTIVVTTENLSLQIIDEPVFLLTDGEEKVLRMLKTSIQRSENVCHSPLATSTDSRESASVPPAIYILGTSTVSSATLASALSVTDKAVRKHLVSLEAKGFVKRIGQRGGWTLARDVSSAADLVSRRDTPPAAGCCLDHPQECDKVGQGGAKLEILAAIAKPARQPSVIHWRLVGNGFPPHPVPVVDPRIVARPLVPCPSCSSGVVLRELAGLTGGRCHGCWQYELSQTVSPKNPRP